MPIFPVLHSLAKLLRRFSDILQNCVIACLQLLETLGGGRREEGGAPEQGGGSILRVLMEVVLPHIVQEVVGVKEALVKHIVRRQLPPRAGT